MTTRAFHLLLAISLAMVSADHLQAGVIYVDFSSFQTRLNEATAAAGVSSFTAAETSTIKSNILTQLSTIYSDFTGLSFSDSAVGTVFETLTYSIFDGTPGSLGVADSIDWLNTVGAQTARVFTNNFGFTLEGSDARAVQIDEISTALAGTGAHELGHNLGLRHHDAYGDLSFAGTPVATGGLQNSNIMATGSTGLDELGRETLREFSTHSKVKLAYAAGTLPLNPTASSEFGDAGNLISTAQGLMLNEISVAGRYADVVNGFLSSGDSDFFELDLTAPGFLTADINNDGISSTDTIISIFDSSMNLLGSNDDTFYSTTSFGSGSFRDSGSILTNVAINTAGKYYVEVKGFGGGGGNYSLLVHTDAIGSAAVPEPGSLTLTCMMMGGFGVWRKRRGRRA
ncbi:MAG: pre-peptidase C-terminal domain-containing protein [Planctomycetaceae bacterium]|nr:pre-peptidase C-terminal domain-containing protein [Planctomycetaceae bacterium]